MQKALQTKPESSYQHQGVRHGWTDLIATSPVVVQSLDYGHGTVTVASSGGGGTQLHTTTTKSYNPETLQCLVCVGEREGHNILDNHEGRGITIMLGDQHFPAVVTSESPTCFVSMRYSNSTMTDLYEYLGLPALKSFARFDSKERAGFTDVFQMALNERMEIKLIVD